MNLPQHVIDQGFRLRALDQIDSTNNEAMRLARAGEPGRVWVIAQEQTAGRGRLSRPWVSAHGNLFASLLLIDDVTPDKAPELGFVTGVALAQALDEIAPAALDLTLKWPNDLLANGAKVAGILLEGSMLADGRFACVIGCGVNCTHHPRETSYPATDLATLNINATPTDVIHAFSSKLALWFDRWSATDGFAVVRRAWLERASGVGQSMNIRLSSGSPSEVINGIFNTIDDRGRLVIDTPAGQRLIDTGDVMLPAGETGTML